MSYIRKCSLIVYGTPPVPAGTGIAQPASSVNPQGIPVVKIHAPQQAQDMPGLDLSNFRIQFHVEAQDVDAPPTARIRVFNLADSTVKQILREFQGVTLQAGYEDGPFGVIFQGSIVRVRRGRLNAIDSFVDILASNLDAIYNFGTVNKTIAAGSTLRQRLNAIQSSVNASPAAQAGQAAFGQGLQFGYIPDSFGTGGTLPRGKVMFGMARDYLGDVADTGGTTWSIGQDGKVNIVPLDSVMPGNAVVLTARTGLINVPEATQQGIMIECLLNPQIKLGTRVQIDNKSLTTSTNLSSQVGFPGYGDFAFFASTAFDGVYRVYVSEFEGDTRGGGNDWKNIITALNVDQSAGNVVAGY